MANGAYKAGVPTVGSPVYVDARDVALAHVRAVERDAAQGQRYLLIGGTYVCFPFYPYAHTAQ
jgi:nucleoside-diphosphate-sugar epimerase